MSNFEMCGNGDKTCKQLDKRAAGTGYRSILFRFGYEARDPISSCTNRISSGLGGYI